MPDFERPLRSFRRHVLENLNLSIPYTDEQRLARLSWQDGYDTGLDDARWQIVKVVAGLAVVSILILLFSQI